ncbi:hypothetical protein MKEN_01309000 [Mycena kentingensis (nom. inval.)]|nr:hypothetical protein MKEN_01309000 [Mycena kentingensis (nom. inval.)]
MQEAECDDLDSLLAIPFLEHEFIGVGKKYTPKTVPPHVSSELNCRLQPPDSFTANYPPKDLPITTFIAHKLPALSSSLVSIKAAEWFSTAPPTNITPEQLWAVVEQRVLPPQALITQLREAAGQRWFDGAKSIRDPRYKSEVFLPLWIVGAYKQLADMLQQQSLWRDAARTVAGYIVRQKPVADAFSSLADVFGTLGWASDTTHGAFIFPAFTFVPLLRSVPLSDEITQAMVNDLRERLAEQPELEKQHYICGSRLYVVLDQLKTKSRLLTDEGLPLRLKEIEERVRRNPELVVWIPLLRNKHEEVIRVDFKRKTIAYGDSIKDFAPPKNLLSSVQTWVKKRFGLSFEIKGRALRSGQQQDSFSCIPAAINMIAAAIFGDDLWTPEKREVDRVRWFVRLSRKGHLASILRRTPIAIADYGMQTSTPNPSPLPLPTISSQVAPISAPLTTGISIRALLNPIDDVEDGSLQDAYLAAACPDDDDKAAEAVPNRSGNQAPAAAEPLPMDDAAMDVDSVPSPPSPKSAWGSFMSKAKSVSLQSRKRRGADANVSDPPPAKKRGRPPKQAAPSVSGLGPVGLAKSSVSDASAKEKQKDGGIDRMKQDRFEQKIHEKDKGAVIDPKSPRVVVCSLCRTPVTCDLYRPKNFLNHYENTQCRKHKSLLENRLDGPRFGHLLRDMSSIPSPPPRASVPCAGITERDEPLVPRYLKRSATLGGGARSVVVIAKEMFGKTYGLLTDEEKSQVDTCRLHEETWFNDHRNMRVFSKDCLGSSVSTRADGQPEPCRQCRDVIRQPRFRAVLHKPTPEPENYRFVNKQFQQSLLASQYAQSKGFRDLLNATDTESIFVRFVKGAMAGEYDDENVFLGLLHAMVQQKDREARGVGSQNFLYMPAWKEFAHIIRIHSPRAYKFLQKHFPVPHIRTLQKDEARAPKLPMEICQRSFASVKEYLSSIGYSGPIAVSCDDTKLFAGLHIHFDTERKAHVLVGAVERPITVLDADALRLWCAQVPLPNIMPVVIAAIPITDSMDVPALLALHKRVIFGLLDADIHPMSYACDGTDTERGVQAAFQAEADAYIERVIPSPAPGIASFTVRIGVFRGHGIALIQDSKHALKTMRNNLFTGARLLTLGNYIATFHPVYNFAFEDYSTLYIRDVERLDRQDDNAAARLFSAQTLQTLIDRYSEHRGLIVYLFIFGEVTDAYQNRHITHLERIGILLRARYFLDKWLAFIEMCPAYKRANYFISRESFDILGYIIHGFLSLVTLHREFYPDLPLLPWLHSTEACEHMFGLARQVVKDFTALDFYRMQPKLSVKLREALFSSRTETKAEIRATAAGYHHTCWDTRKLDLPALTAFPAHELVVDISIQAAAEMTSLMDLLGIRGADVHGLSPQINGLPSLLDMYPDEEFDLIVASEPRLEADFEPAYMTELMQRFETLANAGFALMLDDQQRMCSIEPIDDETEAEMILQDRRALLDADIPSQQYSLLSQFRVTTLRSHNGLAPHYQGSSYDSCDVGTLPNQTNPDGLTPTAALTSGSSDYDGSLSYLPGQRLSRCVCPGESHPGPIHEDGTYVGRSAPEIDIVEAQLGGPGDTLGQVSQSAQWAPFDAAYNWNNQSGNMVIYDTTLSHQNSYSGGIWQEATSVVTTTNQDCYQLKNPCYATHGFEYVPGFDNAYITWITDNKRSWTLLSSGVGPNPQSQIAARPIPQEPLYILANLGLSHGFVYDIDFEHLTFPAKMRVDWVRVYQPKGKVNVGCEPEGFPTQGYINTYIEAYTNANLTTWEGDFKQPVPKSRLNGGC